MVHGSRIYVTGAPCSGVSTLGRELARHLRLPCIDVDDSALAETLAAAAGNEWVLNGPAEGRADELLCEARHILFVATPTTLRLTRLIERDRTLHGRQIEPGGSRHARHLDDWCRAARYDDPTFAGLNRLRQEQWLLEQTCPVHRLDGRAPLPDLVERAIICITGNRAEVS